MNMAYGSPYTTYQPQNPQIMAQNRLAQLEQQNYNLQQMQMQQPKIDMVNGEQGVISYPVQPSTSISLYDEQNDFLYIKQADMYGNITTRKFAVTLEEVSINGNNATQQSDTYATKEEVKDLKNKIELILKELGVNQDGEIKQFNE